MSSSKAKLREKFFEDENDRKVVKIEKIDTEIEIRPLTLQEVSDLSETERKVKDLLKVLVKTVYDPESGDRVFDNQDWKELYDKSANGYVKELISKFNEVNGFGDDATTSSNKKKALK